MGLKKLDAVGLEMIYETGECCVIGFSRKNCHVCQTVMPALVAVSGHYEGRINFYQVDVETDRNLYSRFSLKGVPTILFFKEGEYQGKMTGLVDEEQIKEKIAALL
jgi:thioredoxin 1